MKGDYECAAWLAGSLLAVASSGGQVAIIQGGVLAATLEVPQALPLCSIAARIKGFVAASPDGRVLLFQMHATAK